MAYVLKFGSYTLPATFAPRSDNRQAIAQASQLPRMDGGTVSTRRLTPKSMSVQGGISSSFGNSAIQTQVDTMLTSLQGIQDLYLLRDDRYYRNATMANYSVDYDQNSVTRYAMMNLEFRTGDPFQYSTTLTSAAAGATAVSPINKTLTPTGNAPSLPKFTITATSATSVAITLTNSTTGETCTLTGTVPLSSDIVVDSLLKTVTISGVDYMSLFEGVFPTLAVGSNSVVVSWTGGGSYAVASEYRNRWY